MKLTCWHLHLAARCCREQTPPLVPDERDGANIVRAKMALQATVMTQSNVFMVERAVAAYLERHHEERIGQ
jgi:hypothetical protein